MADRARHDHSGEHGWEFALTGRVRSGCSGMRDPRGRGPGVVDPPAGPAGAGVRGREHDGPFGEKVRVSRDTIDRWIGVARGGFDALVPRTRHGEPRTPAEVLELAAALKREVPGPHGGAGGAILRAHPGSRRRSGPCSVTSTASSSNPPGRAAAAGVRPVRGRPAPTSCGPATRCTARLGGRKTYLFAFIDDHSRALVGTGGAREDTVRLAAALRPAWPRAASRRPSTWTTGPRSSTRGCCAPAPRWASD